MFKGFLPILAALCAAACSAPTPRVPSPVLAPAAPGDHVPRGAIYRIDAAQSEVRILVRRAGPLARLGHDHVIVNRSLGGWVTFPGSFADAALSLEIPVAAFIVDDAGARALEGVDFAEPVPDDAKSGTRRNMLGSGLLDGERFPTIRLTSAALRQDSGNASATLMVSIAGHESVLVVPFAVEIADGRLAASGTVDFKQSALGLTPFTVMLGALQVQDEVTVKFHVCATAAAR